jgi:hypothetical protein
MQAALKPASGEKWQADFLKSDVYWDVGRLSMGSGPSLLQGSVLFDAYLLLLEKKKMGGGETARGHFPRADMP